MDHVQASPYPQSNGKLQRWHKSLKSECLYGRGERVRGFAGLRMDIKRD